MPEPGELVLFGLRILLAAALYGFLGLLLWALLRQPQAKPAEPPPAASLKRVDAQGQAPARYTLRPSTWIGRDPNCSVKVDDEYVSARHARIEWDAGASCWWLEDNASRNGTWLNGERVVRAALKPGDELSIGGARFRFEPEV